MLIKCELFFVKHSILQSQLFQPIGGDFAHSWKSADAAAAVAKIALAQRVFIMVVITCLSVMLSVSKKKPMKI